MKLLFSAFAICISLFAAAQTIQELEAKRVHLPNGWSLTPPGKSLALGDLPLNMAVSPSKKYIAVTNNGQSTQSIQLIDVKKEKLLQTIIIPKSFYGLQFSADEKYLFASGGNDNRIIKYELKNKQLTEVDSFSLGKKWPKKISPVGIAVDNAAMKLYAVTKENNSLYIINLKDKSVSEPIHLGGEGYASILSPDKKNLYISCWGCDRVKVYNTTTGSITDEIKVGDNPNELCLTKNGRYLYVANANDNTVSVIDTKQKKVIETLDAAIYPGAPSGSTPNGIAVSENEKTLFIANADNNCLALFDISNPGYSRSKGFIPTGWYPTNVKVIGKKIFVTNGKGFTSMANPFGPSPLGKKQVVVHHEGDTTKPKDVQYIAGLFKGEMSIINIPNEKTLAGYSKLVRHNSPYKKQFEMQSAGEAGNPIPMKVGDPSPIKYVFYIIKENRTYDQILGDMKEGNGDSSLCLFGEHITPNQHKIAREFVLLDNFYCDGEVSADGHEWTMGAYATDFLEKTWPTNYGGRGGNYAGEGMRNIANNKYYFWDQCKKKNVSYRTYGEFTNAKTANIEVLNNHFSKTFAGWDLSVRDTTRFYAWAKEFDSLLAIDAVPRFNSLRFCNDHTEGMRKDKPTPYAFVADNDWAMGLFIEYLSHSKIWNESVVFAIEDDAQNGADHVDAHRTTAYVAGGLVKSNFVDHTPYSTSSMLRTMELILGLDPMSQYDAAAQPMWRCFNNNTFHVPFNSIVANINLDDKNTAMNEWQRRSEQFNFAKEDAIPDMEFNKVLWYGLKGNVPMPAPRRAAFLRTEKDDD